jgi:GNAT superfamily N-acetyltransferase
MLCGRVPVQEIRELGCGEVGIFRLDADDWALLASLRLQALRDSPAAFLGDPTAELESAEKYWRTDLDLNIWFLAQVAHRDVGIAKLNHTPPANDGMHLEAMWVTRDARGAGVGRCLAAAVESVAAGLGSEQMRLWVLEENLSAERFYLQLGYVQSGRRQSIKANDRTTVETEFEKQLV